MAASKAAMRGATILKASDDKTRALNKHTLMAFVGEAGDTSASDVLLFPPTVTVVVFIASCLT